MIEVKTDSLTWIKQTLFGSRFVKWLMMLALCLACHPCFSSPVKKNHSIAKKTQHHRYSHIQPKHKKKSIPTAKKKHIKTHQRSSISAQHPALMHANNTVNPHLPSYLLSSTEKRLIGFVQQTITTLRRSTYKLGGNQIDTERGIFIVDCSTYVDHIMKSVYPSSYSKLTYWSGSQKPTSNDYYQYFTNLSGSKVQFWDSIDSVMELRPGDILVFRYKYIRGRAGGHVMIVMDKPIQDGDTFLVRVADSAAVGHSKDTRLPNRSGIGIGTLLLRTDAKTLQPSAYAWKVGSHWEYDVNIAMARPKEPKNLSF